MKSRFLWNVLINTERWWPSESYCRDILWEWHKLFFLWISVSGSQWLSGGKKFQAKICIKNTFSSDAFEASILITTLQVSYPPCESDTTDSETKYVRLLGPGLEQEIALVWSPGALQGILFKNPAVTFLKTAVKCNLLFCCCWNSRPII
jgi:hypothetical protein